MRLIVDANIIIAALVKDSTIRKMLFFSNIEFITLKFLKSEIDKNKKELLEKTGLTEYELQESTALILSKLKIIEDADIEHKMMKAKEIMKNIDIDDAKYIALALATENDGIWSDDNHFIKQNKIRIWKTKDLLKYAI